MDIFLIAVRLAQYSSSRPYLPGGTLIGGPGLPALPAPHPAPLRIPVNTNTTESQAQAEKLINSVKKWPIISIVTTGLRFCIQFGLFLPLVELRQPSPVLQDDI